jgi:hypothetical protein
LIPAGSLSNGLLPASRSQEKWALLTSAARLHRTVALRED